MDDKTEDKDLHLPNRCFVSHHLTYSFNEPLSVILGVFIFIGGVSIGELAFVIYHLISCRAFLMILGLNSSFKSVPVILRGDHIAHHRLAGAILGLLFHLEIFIGVIAVSSSHSKFVHLLF